MNHLLNIISHQPFLSILNLVWFVFNRIQEVINYILARILRSSPVFDSDGGLNFLSVPLGLLGEQKGKQTQTLISAAEMPRHLLKCHEGKKSRQQRMKDETKGSRGSNVKAFSVS